MGKSIFPHEAAFDRAEDGVAIGLELWQPFGDGEFSRAKRIEVDKLLLYYDIPNRRRVVRVVTSEPLKRPEPEKPKVPMYDYFKCRTCGVPWDEHGSDPQGQSAGCRNKRPEGEPKLSAAEKRTIEINSLIAPKIIPYVQEKG